MLSALENFAKLRHDLFPHGIQSYGSLQGGSLVFSLPREAFTRSAWLASAGKSRIDERKGIKTCFPANWTLLEVRAAAAAIAKNPVQVTAREEGRGVYFDGIWNGITIRVHVRDSKILRAYPKLTE